MNKDKFYISGDDNFYRALDVLIREEPFYSHLVHQCSVTTSKKIKTISIQEKEGRIIISYSRPWVNELSVKKVVEVVKHVLLHMLFGHISNDNFPTKSSRLDLAMDLAVNSELKRAFLPKGFIHPEDLGLQVGLSTLEYYGLLPNLEESGQSKQDSCDSDPVESGELEDEDELGELNGDNENEDDVDNRDNHEDSGTEEDCDDVENKENKFVEDCESVDNNVAENEEPEKSEEKNHEDTENNENFNDKYGGMRKDADAHEEMKAFTSGSTVLGSLTASMATNAHQKAGLNAANIGNGLAYALKFLLAPVEIPWELVFRRFIAFCTKVFKVYTWKRVSRRFGEEQKGKRTKHRLKVLVGIDESGSISEDQWKCFISELNGIAKLKDTDVIVCKFTTIVESIFKYDIKNMEAMYQRHSGGTLFQPFLDEAEKQKADVVVCLTDGYNFENEIHYIRPQSLLWVLTKQHKEQKLGKSIVLKTDKYSERTTW